MNLVFGIDKKAHIHIKLDTGMGRIGYQNAAEAVADVEKMKDFPMLEIEGVFTHFANADTENKEFTISKVEIEITLNSWDYEYHNGFDVDNDDYRNTDKSK